MGNQLKSVKIRFEDASVAEANVKVSRLRDAILEAVPDVQADVVKDDPSTQDFGGTLVLVFGTPAAIALAKGIAKYLSRERGKIKIEADGGIVAEGLSGTDIARITEALSKRVP